MNNKTYYNKYMKYKSKYLKLNINYSYHTYQKGGGYDKIDNWIQNCNEKLVKYVQVDNPNAKGTAFQAQKTFLTWDDMEARLGEFIQTTLGKLKDTNKWINYDDNKPTDEFLNQEVITEKLYYTQRANCADTDKIIFHGDFHGDIESMNLLLSKLKEKQILNNDFTVNDGYKIVFLGDYVDRGWYGSEIIYVILTLLNKNPGKVYAVRGNHEDWELNKKDDSKFAHELAHKFTESSDINNNQDLTKIRKIIQKFYELLPAALFLKIKGKFYQCCHGGLELGYNPKILLDADEQNEFHFYNSKLTRTSTMKITLDAIMGYFNNNNTIDEASKIFMRYMYATITNVDDPDFPNNDGLLWTDFIVNEKALLKNTSLIESPLNMHDQGIKSLQQQMKEAYKRNEKILAADLQKQKAELIQTKVNQLLNYQWLLYSSSRSWIMGQLLTNWLLQYMGIASIIRAHQHNEPHGDPIEHDSMRQCILKYGPEEFTSKAVQKGVCVLWNHENKLTDNQVWTFGVSSNTYLNFNCDIYAVVDIANDNLVTLEKLKCN